MLNELDYYSLLVNEYDDNLKQISIENIYNLDNKPVCIVVIGKQK